MIERSWRWIMRNSNLHFYWFPGVTPGVYKVYYDGWHLAFSFWIFSLEWGGA